MAESSMVNKSGQMRVSDLTFLASDSQWKAFLPGVVGPSRHPPVQIPARQEDLLASGLKLGGKTVKALYPARGVRNISSL